MNLRPAFPFAPLESALPAGLGRLISYHDARDLSSLFQDDAATTPVTTAGQSVGACRGLVTGALLAESALGRRPVYATDSLSRPVVRLSSAPVQQLSLSFPASLAQPLTIYTLLRVRSLVPANNEVFTSGPTGGQHLALWKPTSNAGYSRWAGSRIDSGVAIGTTSPIAIGQVFAGPDSFSWVGGSVAGIGDSGSSPMGGIRIGADFGSPIGALPSNVDIYAHLVFQRGLSPAELAALDAWSQLGWGWRA